MTEIQTISARIPQAQYAELEAAAACETEAQPEGRSRVTVSDLVRQAISEWLAGRAARHSQGEDA